MQVTVTGGGVAGKRSCCALALVVLVNVCAWVCFQYGRARQLASDIGPKSQRTNVRVHQHLARGDSPVRVRRNATMAPMVNGNVSFYLWKNGFRFIDGIRSRCRTASSSATMRSRTAPRRCVDTHSRPRRCERSRFSLFSIPTTRRHLCVATTISSPIYSTTDHSFHLLAGTREMQSRQEVQEAVA